MGFTIPEIDKVLLPYCKKTFNNAFNLFMHYHNDPLSAEHYALEVLEKELRQGFQSLELKLNTIPSSRGDFAFTTLTFGQWDINLPDEDREFLGKIGKTILETRMKGHGGKQVVFPKLVYLYDKNQIEKDSYAEQLFNEAVKCSSQCMYPDYLSLTGDPEHNVVAKTYLEHGVITSPMGCRAYLTPWCDPETGKYVAIGRCNIGAVSLNLPLIIAIAKQEYPDNWHNHFWNLLEDRMETIREFLKKRFEIIKHTKASTNPMAFCQGGFYKGNLNLDDEIGNLTEYMTASFGITALNEATILWNDKTLHEDKSFANEVLKFINNLITKYKKEDNHLYALYGTPAESLAATQAKQYSDYTGDTQFGEYFTNSFHLHVSEDITPFEKQDEEYEFFHQVNGGHIQYVRLDNPENFEATKAIIIRGMDHGFYQGVNFDSAYCNDCHTHSTNVMWNCPHCGSSNLTVISRVCGYLGYSNVNGKTRMNDGKMKEISERKSM